MVTIKTKLNPFLNHVPLGNWDHQQQNLTEIIFLDRKHTTGLKPLWGGCVSPLERLIILEIKDIL